MSSNLRQTVTALLIAQGFDQVAIRPNGNVRVLRNGHWQDAGRVGDYANEIANARVSDSDRDMMDNGYGQLD